MVVWGWNEIDDDAVWTGKAPDEQKSTVRTARLSATWQVVGAICCVVLAGIVAYCSRPESPLFSMTVASKQTVTQP